MNEVERADLARAIYEAATEGYYVTPWHRLTSDRRWRWLNAADAAGAMLERAHQGPDRARTVRHLPKETDRS